MGRSVNPSRTSQIKCSVCKKWKEVVEFARTKHSRTGHTSDCKICRNEKTKLYESNIVPTYPATSFCSGCQKELNSNLFNKDRTRKTGYSKYCKEHERERKKKYRSDPKNIEVQRAQWARKRIVRAGLPDIMPKGWWTILLNACGNKCCKCGKIDDLTHDHIIPVTWIGSVHSLSNSQVLCGSCNNSKNNYNCLDFRTPDQIIFLLDLEMFEGV